MKLYSTGKNSAAVINHPEHGDFEADEDGAFELPDEFGEQLHTIHVDGKPQFEDGAERSLRLDREALAVRKSPEALHDLIQKLVEGQLAALPAAEVRKASAEELRAALAEAEAEEAAEDKKTAAAEKKAAAAENKKTDSKE